MYGYVQSCIAMHGGERLCVAWILMYAHVW